MVKLLPTERFTLTTQDSLPRVVQNLSAYVEPIKPIRWTYSANHAPYQGTVSDSGFEIYRVIHYRNSFLPIIRGQFEALPVGTAIHVRMGLHPFVLVFVIVWYAIWYTTLTPMWLLGALPGEVALLFLGMPLAIAVVFWSAFWIEVRRSRQDLNQLITGGFQAASYFSQKKVRKGRLIALQLGVMAISGAVAFLQLSQSSPWGHTAATDVSPPPLCTEAQAASPYCGFKTVQTLTGHPAATAIAISTDGQTLVSGGQDKALKLWDLKTGQLKKSVQNDSGKITTVAITADGKTVASGSADRMVRIWRPDSSKPPQLLKGHTDEIKQVAITPDGKTLISGSNQEIILWDLATGQRQNTVPDWTRSQIQLGPLTIDKGPTRLNLLAIDPASKTAIWEYLGSDVVVWDLVKDQQIVALQESFDSFSGYILSAQVSPDGKTAALQYSTSTKKFETRLKVWDLSTGQVLARGSTAFTHSTFVDVPIALSQDAIVGSVDGQLKVWDLKTAQPVAGLKLSWVSPLAISADGKLLAGISGESADQSAQIKILRRP